MDEQDVRWYQADDGTPTESGTEKAAQGEIDAVGSPLRLGQDFLLFGGQARWEGSASLLCGLVQSSQLGRRNGFEIRIL